MRNFTLSICSIAFLGFAVSAQEIQPAAFYKRALVTSITGGPSRVLFITYSNNGNLVKSDMATGRIDPLIMEYGLTNKIGVGFSHGGENYNIDANKFYNANVLKGNEMMWTSSKYLTADISYHPFTTKRLDVSLFAAAGFYKVSGDCYNFSQYTYDSKALYSYTGRGAIIRGGVRSRFYFSKRFGLMAMVYGFNGFAKEKTKPNPITDAPNNTGYSTMLTGCGAEFGICFRIFKQRGVKEEVNLIKKIREKLIKKEREEEESDKIPLFRIVWN